MNLDVAYSYCINLTEQEKLDIDKQIRNNRLRLEFFEIYPFLPFPIVLIPEVLFFPFEGFRPH